MICITWWEPTDSGFYRDHHCYCDALGAYEYDEVLHYIKAQNYDYEIEEIEEIE